MIKPLPTSVQNFYLEKMKKDKALSFLINDTQTQHKRIIKSGTNNNRRKDSFKKNNRRKDRIHQIK